MKDEERAGCLSGVVPEKVTFEGAVKTCTVCCKFCIVFDDIDVANGKNKCGSM
jgi:hypothetical protein